MSETSDAVDSGPGARNRNRSPTGRAARLALSCGLLAVALGLPIAGIGDAIPRTYQYMPLVASALVLGVPHGAVDHLVLPRARDEPITGRSLAFVGLVYLLVGSVYAVLWFLAPAAAFVLFILVTLLHWGQGDVYALVKLYGADHLSTTSLRGATAIVRGSLPMLIPLIAFPEEYRFVAGTLIGLFDPGAVDVIAPAFEPTIRLGVAVGFGVVVVGTLGVGYLRARRIDSVRAWGIDAGETLLLVAFFGLVPPILAIGLYFPLWHSLRHILRTMLVDDRAVAALTGRSALGAFRRFGRDAAPLTAGAFLVLGGIALAVPRTPATIPDAVGLYLVFIAVLTLPHVVIVSLLDREQGVWTPQGLSTSRA